MWQYYHERISINMIAVLGDDILEYSPIPDEDEKYLTKILPEKAGRHSAVDGNALAVHYSFCFQGGLDTTDVLDRYRSYALEMICQS